MLSDSELDARLRFLEERLDDGETWAKLWQWGWAGGYSASVVYETARAIAVGELSIWSEPQSGIQDLSDYQTRFEMKTASRFHWAIVPTMGGAAVMVTF